MQDATARETPPSLDAAPKVAAAADKARQQVTLLQLLLVLLLVRVRARLLLSSAAAGATRAAVQHVGKKLRPAHAMARASSTGSGKGAKRASERSMRSVRR
jgi:hypothetical protein